MIIELDKIKKSFGVQLVLENVSARVDDNDKIGLIGNNGAGKSTLLNIIYNELETDEGSVFRGSGKRFGFLRQNNGLNGANTIESEMRTVFAGLDEMEANMRADELQLAELAPDSQEYATVAARYATHQGQFELAEGYQIKAKIATVLNGMGFGQRDWDTVVGVLSGGEQTRLAICKLLLEEPDLLILDEPTNHLDFPTLIWLENYLKDYRGALLIVSHDRFFLDKLCSDIWEMENHHMETYKGNYTKYLTLKKHRLDSIWKEYEKQQEEIAALKDFVARNLVRASTTKRAQSRQNTLDRMEVIERPKLPPKPPSIHFKAGRQPVSDILILEDVALSVGEEENHKHLFSGLNLTLKRGEKIALVGHNGIGKSSLLKAVQKKIPIDSGTVTWGRNTDVSYFEQGEGEMKQGNQVIEELWGDFRRETENTIRSTLGHAGLRGEEVYKKVKNLSGGERARLKFAKLMLKDSNVLLLDEPTNHLDLATKEVLDKALTDFEGTLLVVSHDRYLLNKFPDKIVEMKEDGVTTYLGKYDDYARKKEQESVARESKEAQQEEPVKKSQSSYRSKEQRRQDTEQRQRLGWLKSEIEKLESQVSSLETEITLPEVMSDYEALEKKCTLLEENRTTLNDYLEEWLTLEENN